jgi:uncharacterized protein (DUF1800 family)
MLARHPGTARYVCTKIARRLLADDPDPALVDRLAGVFLTAADADDQIAQVIRALVLSPEFEAPPSKLRRPFEFLVALYRATGAEVISTENGFQWQLSRAGWRQHEYGPPTGHPDRMEAWTGASTLNRLADIAIFAHDEWFATGKADLTSVMGAESAGDFIARHAAALVPARGAEIAAAVAEVAGVDLTSRVADFDLDARLGTASAAITFAALTPEFLLR